MINNKAKNAIETTEYYISAPVDSDIRIVFVSDLHEYPPHLILDEVRKVTPELILLGGDIIHSTTRCEKGIEFLKLVSQIAPTYSAIGNHERIYEGNIYSLFIDCGVIPLDDAAIQYKNINIGGLSSPTKKLLEENNDNNIEKKPDLDWLKEFCKIDGYKLLLYHQPEFYNKYIRSFNVDLTLSGHAHGGQWRIKKQGIFAPGQGLFPKYTSGIHENRLIISRGIGNAYLIPRINNKPEILKIILQSN